MSQFAPIPAVPHIIFNWYTIPELENAQRDSALFVNTNSLKPIALELAKNCDAAHEFPCLFMAQQQSYSEIFYNVIVVDEAWNFKSAVHHSFMDKPCQGDYLRLSDFEPFYKIEKVIIYGNNIRLSSSYKPAFLKDDEAISGCIFVQEIKNDDITFKALNQYEG